MMKKCICFVFCVLITACASTKSPDLGRLNEQERNKILTKVALETIHKYASEFYADSMLQRITSFSISTGKNNGRKAYSVAYYSNEEKNLKDQFSVLVCIFSDTGKAYLITSEEGMGIQIDENDKSNERLRLQKTIQETGK